jgi:hypothetical protein
MNRAVGIHWEIPKKKSISQLRSQRQSGRKGKKKGGGRVTHAGSFQPWENSMEKVWILV